MKTKFVILTAFVLLLSCENQENDITTDTQLVARQAFIDFSTEFDTNLGFDLSSENNISGKNVDSNTFALPACVDVTFDNNNGQFPKTFTINFGEGCTFSSGITRKGILTIVFSGPIYEFGSTMTISRNNYFVNNISVMGTVVLQNTTVSAGLPQWTRSINNGQLVFPGNFTINFTDNRTIQMTEGASTVTRLDNVFQIVSGVRTVARSNGTNLTLTVLEPLIKKFVCPHLSQGKIQFVGTNLNGVLDYGDNTCNNQATFTTTDGTVFNINL